MSKRNGVALSLIFSAVTFVTLLIIEWSQFFRIVPEMLVANLLISFYIFVVSNHSYKEGYNDAEQEMFDSCYFKGYNAGYNNCLADHKPDYEPDDEEK